MFYYLHALPPQPVLAYQQHSHAATGNTGSSLTISYETVSLLALNCYYTIMHCHYAYVPIAYAYFCRDAKEFCNEV